MVKEQSAHFDQRSRPPFPQLYEQLQKIHVLENRLEAIGKFNPDGSLKEGFQRNGDRPERQGGGEVPPAARRLFQTPAEVGERDTWSPPVPARSIPTKE